MKTSPLELNDQASVAVVSVALRILVGVTASIASNAALFEMIPAVTPDATTEATLAITVLV